MSDNTLKINSIPSPTWNWLKMNDALIEKVQGRKDEEAISISSPEGVYLSKEDSAYADDIKGAMGELFDKELQSGASFTTIIKNESGKEQSEPVIISAEFDDNSVNGSKFVVEAQKNSEIIVLEDLSSGKNAKGRACVQTLIKAEEGANVKLVQINRLGNEFELINDVGAILDENVHISIVNVFLGGSNVYQGCNIDLRGDNSSVNKDIGYFLSGTQNLDMNYVVLHKGKKTNCDIKVSGVLEGNSSKLFRGTIDFRNGCAGSKGAEIEEVILRDDTVVNKTIPVILCAEEDVEGSHGASIGRIDEDLIFYMQTRGFEEEEIYRLITRSRLLSFCSKIPDEEIRNKTMTYLNTEQ